MYPFLRTVCLSLEPTPSTALAASATADSQFPTLGSCLAAFFAAESITWQCPKENKKTVWGP